ncbi:MAG: cupin domain-containing protein [Candidatus Limnocylindria bacterium]
MDGIKVYRFEDPHEARTFDLGKFELINAAGMTIGRAEYEPGWRWSEHVGKAIDQALCPTPHLGMVLSGRNRVEMADGMVVDLRPGDVFAIGPGHDSWVLGEERYVSLHFLGAEAYATK